MQHTIFLGASYSKHQWSMLYNEKYQTLSYYFLKENLFLFSVSVVKIKYFQSYRARSCLWLDTLSYPYWDRYDKEQWIKLQQMSWNIFSALFVLSICHLIVVIVTWFQGWLARQIDLIFFCASILTACQRPSPAESERMEEGEQVEVDTGGPGTSTLSRDLMCFYSPLLSSHRSCDG